MDLHGYLKALRKSWWVIVLCAGLGGGVGLALALTATPQYRATVQFFAATPASGSSNPLAGDQFGQQRVNSYTVLLSSQRLAQMVLDDTQLKLSVNSVMNSINGSADLNTVILTATVTSSTPETALRVATSVATEFPALVKQIESQNGTKTAPVALDVVSGPRVSPSPISPRKKLDVALGVAAGLIVGLAFAILRELLDTSVRSVEALQSIANFPVLGTIAYDNAAKKRPIIVDTHARSIRAEAFRQLRTNLQFVDIERPASVIVVTSSTAGEGKSTTATNLAITFAETGRTVLLVEADLRRPRVADYLGLERAVGLTNVLAGQVAVRDALQTWGRGGLTVLPSGSIPPNPSELLGSGAMRQLVTSLRGRFDMIIIDTPPLLPVTDAAVAATSADGVVLVVRYGKTRRAQVAAAISSLQAVDGRILGTIMNMMPARGADAPSAYRAYEYYDDDPSSVTKAGLSTSPKDAEPTANIQHDESLEGEDGGSGLELSATTNGKSPRSPSQHSSGDRTVHMDAPREPSGPSGDNTEVEPDRINGTPTAGSPQAGAQTTDDAEADDRATGR